jgi:DNA-binding CsgD family transcriptional regulator
VFDIKLTPRQTQVFEFLHQGLSNKEIARKLSISEATVKIYITAILEKYEVTSTKRLVANTEVSSVKSEPIDLDSAPIGWVKRNTRGIKGFMFTKRSPGDGWEPIYTKEKNEPAKEVTLEKTQ